MRPARTICIWAILSLGILVAGQAHTDESIYTLENVILDDGNVPMTGTFSWTYDPGDFENGVGQFTFLEIPYTLHDHTDLDAVFDVGTSIEITLEGSVHDDGVDITLFLSQPLTPTTPSPVDLIRSKYEIGGNGFHDGLFVSGDVLPAAVTDVGDGPVPAAPASTLTIYPNPFNPRTTLTYFVAQGGPVRLSIHDVAGRLVATLMDGFSGAGELSYPWNGRDSNGDEVRSGTYFARLEAGDDSVTKKMILLR